MIWLEPRSPAGRTLAALAVAFAAIQAPDLEKGIGLLILLIVYLRSE